ncbi:MAG: zinc-binding dehydrogenase [bacterium]
MRALLYHIGEKVLQLSALPEPEPEPDEVVVQLKACGLCGTDVHIVREGSIPTAFSPIVVGHEPAGVIAEVGSQVSNWQVGDRVAVYPAAFCGECSACRNGREGLCFNTQIFGLARHGAMAERMTAPARALVKLPDKIPFEIGAILTDAVSTPYHAVVKRGRVQQGESVAIFGCGGLGSQAIRFCKLFGASRIIAVDRNVVALENALKAGATDSVQADSDTPPHKQVRQLTDGLGVDVAFEFVGLQQTIDSAVRSLRRGGRAVVVGIGVEKIQLPAIRTFVGNEYELKGSMGLDLQDLKDVVALVAQDKLELKGATQAIAFAAVNEALQNLEQGRAEHARYVVSLE